MAHVRVRLEEMEYRPADRSLVVLGVDEFQVIVTVVISPVYPRQLAADLQFVAGHPDARVVVGQPDPGGNPRAVAAVPVGDLTEDTTMQAERDDRGEPLGRRPEDDEGDPVGRPFDGRGDEAAERRSERGAKPYTTEDETYRSGPQRRPDDPVQRDEARRPPRR